MTKFSTALPEVNPIIRADLERITSSSLPWSNLRGKTILVTGGAGFLAAYIIKSLLTIGRVNELSIHVICVVRNFKSIEARLSMWRGTPDFSIYQQDVTEPFPSDIPRADFVIHAASQASPKYYAVDPIGTLRANSVGTMNLLDYAVKNQVEKFIFFSSGEVYGIPTHTGKLVSELDYGYLDPLQTRSCYAESKRFGETMCAAWAQQHGLHTNVIRPFHTYGPGMALDDGRVFADFVADVVARRNIVIKSDGMAKRPFCYIADATIGFLTVLMTGAKTEAYNVGNPDAESSIKDLAIMIAALFPERGIGTRFDFPASSSAYLKSPISRSCPDIDKIRGLGWCPIIGLEDGFRRTIQSFLFNT